MMNSKEIFKKVGGIITELTEQYQYLSKSPDQMNDLELELFLANSNFLSDHIEILRKINNSSSKPAGQPEVKPESTPVEIVSEEKKAEQQTSAAQTEKEPLQDENTETDTDQPGDEETIEPVKEDVSQSEKPEPVKEEKESLEDINSSEEKSSEQFVTKEPEKADEDQREAQPRENKSSQNISAEKPEQEVVENATTHTVVQSEKTIAIPKEEPAVARPTINDMLAKPANETPKYNQSAITDLKSGISLNDKLLFVKDLFNGYSLAYSEAVELLNRFESFESADNFLKTNYSVKNNWAEKQQTADKFYEILSRKFNR